MFVSALALKKATDRRVITFRSRHNGGSKCNLIFFVLHFKSDFLAFIHTLGWSIKLFVFDRDDETLSVQDVVRFLFELMYHLDNTHSRVLVTDLILFVSSRQDLVLNW